MLHETQPGCRFRRTGRRLAGAVLTAFGLALVLDQTATAQTFDRPMISVARTIAVQPPAQVAFPVQVSRAPRHSFARVRGLPATASLSEGHSVSAGTWAVPLNVLSGLSIQLPPTAAGTADILVSLVGPGGSVLAETQCTLVIVPAPAPAPAPAKSSDDGTRALKLLEKGNEQLAQGLVASARQLYERATDMGLAQAAMALAATYDPAEFEGLELRGVQADAKEARRWYERAQALGASDAGLRLMRLEQR